MMCEGFESRGSIFGFGTLVGLWFEVPPTRFVKFEIRNCGKHFFPKKKNLEESF